MTDGGREADSGDPNSADPAEEGAEEEDERGDAGLKIAWSVLKAIIMNVEPPTF